MNRPDQPRHWRLGALARLVLVAVVSLGVGFGIGIFAMVPIYTSQRAAIEALKARVVTEAAHAALLDHANNALRSACNDSMVEKGGTYRD